MEPNWKVLLALVVVFIALMVTIDRILTVPTFETSPSTTTSTLYVSDITILDIDEFLTTTTTIPPFDIDDPSTYPEDIPNPPIDPNDKGTWPTWMLLPDRCPTNDPCD